MQHPAQTLAWDLSMFSFMSSFSVLLGPRIQYGILQVFHNSAKAHCETELFGLSLSWSHVVTPVCDTVELRSGLSSAAQVLERLCFNLGTWGLSLAKGAGQSLH